MPVAGAGAAIGEGVEFHILLLLPGTEEGYYRAMLEVTCASSLSTTAVACPPLP